jgi:hypothetical protein
MLFGSAVHNPHQLAWANLTRMEHRENGSTVVCAGSAYNVGPPAWWRRDCGVFFEQTRGGDVRAAGSVTRRDHHFGQFDAPLQFQTSQRPGAIIIFLIEHKRRKAELRSHALFY